MKKLALIAAAAMIFATAAKAETRSEDDSLPWFPVGLSIVSAPIQIPTTAYSVYGVMLDVGYGQVTDSYLVNAGLINNVTRNMYGVQAGPVNLAGDLVGVQAGVFNYAHDPFGVQLGVVNIAGHLHGLQLGILNINMTGMPVFPIFNMGF